MKILAAGNGDEITARGSVIKPGSVLTIAAAETPVPRPLGAPGTPASHSWCPDAVDFRISTQTGCPCGPNGPKLTVSAVGDGRFGGERYVRRQSGG